MVLVVVVIHFGELVVSFKIEVRECAKHKLGRQPGGLDRVGKKEFIERGREGRPYAP